MKLLSTWAQRSAPRDDGSRPKPEKRQTNYPPNELQKRQTN
jgi:hypothetical protein